MGSLQIAAVLIALTWNAAAFAGEGVDATRNETFNSSFNWKALQAPGSICSAEMTNFARTIKKQGDRWDENTPSNTSFLSSVKDSNVVIAGEMHLYTDLKARLELIKTFRKMKGSKACVAFELPKKQEGTEAFLAGLKKGAIKNRDQDASLDQDREDFLGYYAPMVKLAKSIGMTSISVDHPDNFDRSISLGERNISMADNISISLVGKSCSAVLLFVGKAHEAKSVLPTIRISDLLKRRGLQPVSINIQMTGENWSPPATRTWDTCSSPSLSESFVIPRSLGPENVKLAPRMGEQVAWSDFDFTLVLSNDRLDIPSVNRLQAH